MVAEGSIGNEPEPTIVIWIAQNDTSISTKGFYLVETGIYQPNADPLPLSVGSYGNWP